FLKPGDRRDLTGGKAEKFNLWPYRILCRSKIYTLLHHRPVSPISRLVMIEDGNLGATLDRHAPYAGHTAPFGIIQKPTVRRLDIIETTLLRDLNGRPARGRHLPDLEAAAASGAEIDPLPVMRPARHSVIGGVTGQAVRLAAFGVDYINPPPIVD